MTAELLTIDFRGFYRDTAINAMSRGDYPTAATNFAMAEPQYLQDADFLADYAITLRRIGNLRDAFTKAQAAVNVDGDHTVALNELGNIFRLAGQADAAAECFKHAVESWPAWVATHPVLHFDEAELRSNLAVGRHEQCDYPEAIAEYRRALALNPTCKGALWNLPLAHLMIEQFAEGWAAHDARFKTGWMDEQERGRGRPLWRGEDLMPLQKLHIWGEQGVGDQVVYASLLAGWRPPFEVVFECNPKLENLFKRALPHLTVTSVPVALDESVAAQIPLGSIAQYLRPDWRTSPPKAYLEAEPSHTFVGGLTVGIAWASPNAKVSIRKSIPVQQLAPVLEISGVQFVDLQYGDTSHIWKALRAQNPSLDVTTTDVDHFNDLDAHARLIASCDLIVTASNTTAHIAGALGKETWVMPPRGQGQFWYWFQQRDASLVYPNVKLFRQEISGDWSAPIAAITTALKEKTLTARKSS